MEVLIEVQDKITPVRVVLELLGSAIDRTPAVFVLEEDVRKAARNLLGDLIQVHLPTGAGGTFHGEIIAVVGVILQAEPG